MKNAFHTRSIIEKKNNLLLNTQTSRYNSKLYIDHCNICKKQYKDVIYDVYFMSWGYIVKDLYQFLQWFK